MKVDDLSEHTHTHKYIDGHSMWVHGYFHMRENIPILEQILANSLSFGMVGITRHFNTWVNGNMVIT